jgi:hypothetical protein
VTSRVGYEYLRTERDDNKLKSCEFSWKLSVCPIDELLKIDYDSNFVF